MKSDSGMVHPLAKGTGSIQLFKYEERLKSYLKNDEVYGISALVPELEIGNWEALLCTVNSN